jgi:serine/threonine protein kinase
VQASHSLWNSHREFCDVCPAGPSCVCLRALGRRSAPWHTSLLHNDSCMSRNAGTLDYLAPEMLVNPNTNLEEGLASPADLVHENISPYGPSVDVWAVGVIAYELVTGAAPFSRKGDSENDTMQRIMHWHDIDFPGSLSQQWAHFCRCARAASSSSSSSRACARTGHASASALTPRWLAVQMRSREGPCAEARCRAHAAPPVGDAPPGASAARRATAANAAAVAALPGGAPEAADGHNGG